MSSRIQFSNINSSQRTWWAMLILLPVLLLSACASNPPGLPTQEELAKMHVHHLQVVNNSKQVINAIRYKPCGGEQSGFHTLAQNLMPQERVAFNLFDNCIDVQAVNTFDQTLSEQKGLVMSENAVWELH